MADIGFPPEDDDDEQDNVDCTVCYASLLPTRGAALLRACAGCGNIFHQECLEKWKKNQLKDKQEPNCPTCRESYFGSKVGVAVRPVPVREEDEREAERASRELLEDVDEDVQVVCEPAELSSAPAAASSSSSSGSGLTRKQHIQRQEEEQERKGLEKKRALEGVLDQFVDQRNKRRRLNEEREKETEDADKAARKAEKKLKKLDTDSAALDVRDRAQLAQDFKMPGPLFNALLAWRRTVAEGEAILKRRATEAAGIPGIDVDADDHGASNISCGINQESSLGTKRKLLGTTKLNSDGTPVEVVDLDSDGEADGQDYPVDFDGGGPGPRETKKRKVETASGGCASASANLISPTGSAAGAQDATGLLFAPSATQKSSSSSANFFENTDTRPPRPEDILILKDRHGVPLPRNREQWPNTEPHRRYRQWTTDRERWSESRTKSHDCRMRYQFLSEVVRKDASQLAEVEKQIAELNRDLKKLDGETGVARYEKQQLMDDGLLPEDGPAREAVRLFGRVDLDGGGLGGVGAPAATSLDPASSGKKVQIQDEHESILFEKSFLDLDKSGQQEYELGAGAGSGEKKKATSSKAAMGINQGAAQSKKPVASSSTLSSSTLQAKTSSTSTNIGANSIAISGSSSSRSGNANSNAKATISSSSASTRIKSDRLLPSVLPHVKSQPSPGSGGPKQKQFKRPNAKKRKNSSSDDEDARRQVKRPRLNLTNANSEANLAQNRMAFMSTKRSNNAVPSFARGKRD